jgi:hypothetical protein
MSVGASIVLVSTFIPKEFLQAQEKLMIDQAPQTQKLVDQLIALNNVCPTE